MAPGPGRASGWLRALRRVGIRVGGRAGHLVVEVVPCLPGATWASPAVGPRALRSVAERPAPGARQTARQGAGQTEHPCERVDGGGSDRTRATVGDDLLEDLTQKLTRALGTVRTLGFEVPAGAQVVPEFRGRDGPVVGQVVEGSVVLPDELAA